MSHYTYVLGALIALCFASPARAQFGGFLDKVVDKAEKSAERKAQDAAGKAVDQAINPKKEAAKPAAPGQSATQQAPAGAKAGTQEDSAPSPEAYGNRYDFVPGDKVLVYDDFTDTDVGEFPARWTVKNGGGGNPLEVVQVGDRRFVKSRYLKDHQPTSSAWLRYEVKGDMPNKFTIEFDLDVAGPLAIAFSNWSNWGGQEVYFNRFTEGAVSSKHATGRLPTKSGVQHVAIAVAGTQVKVYVAGERVLADPDGVERPVKRIGFQFMDPYKGGDHQMFTNFRVAEGGKDAKTLLATGRIVTHGILFDTGSDVIKPESNPTLRNILALLNDDRSLAFAIEGHTDNQGGPAVNGPLSERRAAAVKAWLVKQGVDEKRLSAKGLGATKSIDTNDTLEGRANNRRVEFVRVSGGAS